MGDLSPEWEIGHMQSPDYEGCPSSKLGGYMSPVWEIVSWYGGCFPMGCCRPVPSLRVRAGRTLQWLFIAILGFNQCKNIFR